MKTDLEIEKLAQKKYPIKTLPLTYYTRQEGFIEGYKQAQQELYSEDEVIRILQEFKSHLSFEDEINETKWFNQVKKKKE